MKQGYEKYIPFVPLKRDRRSWPDKELKKAPVWCSVDLQGDRGGISLRF